MKHKKILIVFVFGFVSGIVKSQDTIVKINGEVILSKVLEITPTEIKYKRFDMLDGPTYINEKENVRKIKYANGVSENFNEESAVKTDYYVEPKVLNTKIERYRNSYVYKDITYREKGIQSILLTANDNHITSLVNSAKQAKSLQYVGFLAIPLGMVAAISGVLALDELSYGAQSSNFSTIAGVTAVAAIACPIISVSFKMKREKCNNLAIKLFNEKQ